MSAIHRAAAVGFERGAADYERGRPGYPDAAIEILASELEIGPGKRIVDLAAGTGKLTRALVRLGADLVAVEPVAGMRAQLVAAVPGVTAVEGTAERLPFQDGTIDAVLVAQAFHWFDVPAAAAEIHRVLVAGGGLGVIRNEWDRSVPWVDELQQLVRQQRGHEPNHPSRDWRGQLQATGLFSAAAEREVPNLISADLETLVARIASLSFIAAMDDPQREALLGQVRRLVQDRGVVQLDGTVPTPYRTHVYCYRAAGP